MSENTTDGHAGALVDIIIVNWNSGDLLARCIASIAEHGRDGLASVTVVDNGSVDRSMAIDDHGLPLHIIETGANLGFGRACNIGAKAARGRYILLLNPDTELHAGGLAKAVRFFEAADGPIGVVGIRLVDRLGNAQRHCGRAPTWRTMIGNSLGLTQLLPRWFPSILMADFDHLSSRTVDHVMGAFYLIRRDLYEALGGFDERYFVYMEDLDLSLRVRQAGKSIHYLAEAEAYHKQGGTSEQVKAHRLFYSLRSNVVYAFKHFSRPTAFLIFAVTYVVEPIPRSVRALLRLSPRELWFTWRGFGMLYRATPSTLRTLRSVATRSRSIDTAPAIPAVRDDETQIG